MTSKGITGLLALALATAALVLLFFVIGSAQGGGGKTYDGGRPRLDAAGLHLALLGNDDQPVRLPLVLRVRRQPLGDRMSLRGNLYKSARLLGDAQALSSGDPNRIARRAKNKALGRLLRPLWRTLWR